MQRPAMCRYLYGQSLGFEILECRSLMTTGLSAVLTNGVLNITDTNTSDNIVVQQIHDGISVVGLSSTFSASSVQSININGGSGNHLIQLNTLNVSTQLCAKPITVSDKGGSDDIRVPSGSDIYASGTHTLTYNGKGTVLLDGKAPTWADMNIHDAALRQLLDQDLAAGAINRTEMLTLFKQVDLEGCVSSMDFADLTALAKDTQLFGSNTAVSVLTQDVVLGNPANATFLGASLGNLAVSTSTKVLDDLVGKWFLGTDHPVASFNGTTFVYAKASGTLFGSNGPQYTDVNQGEVGDCYFVGTLAEIALQDPAAIKNMFIVNGDGTYTVRFFNGQQAEYVTVDSQLPVTSSGTLIFSGMGQRVTNTSNVLWVDLAEKAYAQINQSGWLREHLPGSGQNSYQAISGGYMSDVVLQVTGHSSSVNNLGSTGTTLAAAFTSGHMVELGSINSPTDTSVVGDHCYAVVGYNATTKEFTLFNPWGINNGSNMPGLITLSWAQIEANFTYSASSL